jgi:hypothetical protein
LGQSVPLSLKFCNDRNDEMMQRITSYSKGDFKINF